MGVSSNHPSRAGPLALVGGDELKPGNEPQDEVLVAAASGGPAFVVATAAARQRPDLALRNARAWFKGLGLEVEELPAIRRSDVTSPKNAELARAGRFFYLLGGDPGLVPKTLADTLLWNAIVEAWREGAALAGSSAGAMALGEWTLIRDRRPGDAQRRYRSSRASQSSRISTGSGNGGSPGRLLALRGTMWSSWPLTSARPRSGGTVHGRPSGRAASRSSRTPIDVGSPRASGSRGSRSRPCSPPRHWLPGGMIGGRGVADGRTPGCPD
jgi:hypothetical protein